MKFSTQTLIAAMTAASLGGAANAAVISHLGAGGVWENAASWTGGVAPADDLATDIAQLVGGSVGLSTARQVGGIDLSAGTTTLTGTGSLEVGSAFGTTGSGNLVINVPTVTLRGTDTALDYTGGITVGAGSTLVSERNAIRLDTGSHANTTIILDGGTVAATGDHLELTGRDISLTASGGTLRHAHARNIFGLSGNVISGVGELTLANAVGASSSTAGRIQLQGANTYTGGTNITEGGQAWVYTDASLGAAGTSVRMSDGGTYFAANGVDLGTRAFIIEPGTEVENARISTNGKTTTIGGTISGTGDLDILGTGTLVVNTSGNTLSGNVLIDGAAVRYSGASALGTGVITLDNGGELYGSDHMDLSGNTSIVLEAGGGTFRHRHARNIFGLSGVVISGSGALTLAGESDSGIIQLQGTSNTYTGGTIFDNGGYARVNANGALGDASGSITFSGGILQNNNSNVDLGARDIIVDADGGTLIAGWSNRRITSDGLISGVGKLTIANDSSTVRFRGANTFSGGLDIFGTLWAESGALGTGDVTLNNTHGSRGQLQNYEGAATHSNNIIVGADGGRLQAGWNSTLTLTGAISGSGDLDIVADSGSVILDGVGSYSGVVTVESGATLGGDGSIAGDLTIDAGGMFAFDVASTLDVNNLNLDSTFGVDDLVGLSSSTALGTYTLITTITDVSHIENFGEANAFDLGDGVTAFFQNGSLELVVAPEPGSLALMALGTLAMLRRRQA